jgi:hypothetical protein
MRFRPTIPLACDFLLPWPFRSASKVSSCVSSVRHDITDCLLHYYSVALLLHGTIYLHEHNWWRFLFFLVELLRYFFSCFRPPFFDIRLSLHCVAFRLTWPWAAAIQLNKLVESVAKKNHLCKVYNQTLYVAHVAELLSARVFQLTATCTGVTTVTVVIWFENSPAVVLFFTAQLV